MRRLELLIRGEEPDGLNEIAFARCYSGTIVNEPLFDIAADLKEKIDFEELTTLDWKYLYLGLIMGDKDYRDTINPDNKDNYH